ncbi:hypothetical protein LPW11_22175 [Geomonas sp. RF6]|uniref:hypothetical protein n=1 Tax=Geomonas sp. RF6 TaxID=2897342 RepID=UPI001E632323|nr:hypothetical protein [Geomonas sp. RF6]UFS70561.1 hypothetical protein LPW11_22175 [Geomonas sp. RF6]
MYVARDKNSELYLFDKLPVRGNECWWAETGVDGTYLRLDRALFPEVTWETDPLQVFLTTEVQSGTA